MIFSSAYYHICAPDSVYEVERYGTDLNRAVSRYCSMQAKRKFLLDEQTEVMRHITDPIRDLIRTNRNVRQIVLFDGEVPLARWLEELDGVAKRSFTECSQRVVRMNRELAAGRHEGLTGTLFMQNRPTFVSFEGFFGIIWKAAGVCDDDIPNLDEAFARRTESDQAFHNCKERQKKWAGKYGLKLIGSKGGRGDPAYTPTIEDNLFQPMSLETRQEFEEGDGDELTTEDGPAKMQAVHSSSALTVNLFDYWRGQEDCDPLLQAFGLSEGSVKSIEFEAKRPIMDSPNREHFPRDPNLDVTIAFADSNELPDLAFECKFTEVYRTSEPSEKGLAPAYLREEHLWIELPNCRELGQRICPRDDVFVHLHAAQLLKHTLGLKHRNSLGRFVLVYLWYDVPGSAAAKRHGEEVDRFREIVSRDGLAFRALTFQDVIECFSKHRDGHEAYIDYLTGRYL